MAGMFGAPVGQSAAISDMATLAQTQGQEIKNAAGMQALQEQQRLAQIMQGLSGKGTPVEMMEEASTAALKAGLPSAGMDMAKGAAELRLRQQQMGHAAAQQRQQDMLTAKTQLTMAERLLGGVTDQASWESANRTFEQLTGEPSPFGRIPYDPATIAQLKSETLSMKDQLDLQIKQQNADTRAAQAEGAASFRDFRRQNMEENTRIRRMQAERQAKAAGSRADVGAPTKGELDRAADIVRKAYPQLPDGEINDAAYAVASRARGVRKSNPGVDADEAFQRAMSESAREFQTLNENYKIGGITLPFGQTETTHFRAPGAQGKSAAAPIAQIPSNPADRKVGSYYSHGGKVYQWQKGGWKAVAAPRAAPAAGDTGDESDEEE